MLLMTRNKCCQIITNAAYFHAVSHKEMGLYVYHMYTRADVQDWSVLNGHVKVYII